MYRCLICRFEVVLDDTIAPTRLGSCICLRCYTRETKSERPMPRELRRAIEAVIRAG